MSTSAKRPRRTIKQGRALLAAWQASGLIASAFMPISTRPPEPDQFLEAPPSSG